MKMPNCCPNKDSDMQAEDMVKENGFMKSIDQWSKDFSSFVLEKEK
jgi:hypothetical protein